MNAPEDRLGSQTRSPPRCPLQDRLSTKSGSPPAILLCRTSAISQHGTYHFLVPEASQLRGIVDENLDPEPAEGSSPEQCDFAPASNCDPITYQIYPISSDHRCAFHQPLGHRSSVSTVRAASFP